MTVEELKKFIYKTYDIECDSPWIKNPEDVIFRHRDNKKWFVLLMPIPKRYLKITGDEIVDVINVKCEPELILTLLGADGIYPAYHMNKEKWISIVLNEAADENIKNLIKLSFELTK